MADTEATPTDLDPQTAAHYVLRHAGTEGDWIRPGPFYEHLVAAMFRADQENLVRLSLGFPTLAECMRLYRQDVDLLIEVAG